MVDSKMPDSRTEAAALLTAVADPIRLELLHLLVGRTRCVCDLQPEPPIPGNLLSYHLKVLREAGLIEGTRRGRWIDYSLASLSWSDDHDNHTGHSAPDDQAVGRPPARHG